MTIDNLPLFNAVNDEEVKPPFHKNVCPPHGRPFTSQEAHYEIIHRVEACISEVHRFEERVRYDIEKFTRETNTENQAFKEALQEAHNCFLTAVQHEVNNFEQSMRNDYDLFRSDVDARFADFVSSVNNSFTTFSDTLTQKFEDEFSELSQGIEMQLNSMVSTSEALMDDLRALKASLNERYIEFSNGVNNAMQLHRQQVDEALTIQNNTINDARDFMVNNLTSHVRKIFGEKIESGEITELMREIFGLEHEFRGSYVYDQRGNITNIVIGDYFYCTDNEHYYMWGKSYLDDAPAYTWYDIGSGSTVLNQLQTSVENLQLGMHTREIVLEVQETGYLHPTTGRLVKEEESAGAGTYAISKPIPVIEGMEEIVLDLQSSNTYISRVTFFTEVGKLVTGNYMISTYTTGTLGRRTITIPEGAKCFYVGYNASEVAGSKPYPRVYIPNYDTLILNNVDESDYVDSAIADACKKHFVNPANFEAVPLSFDTEFCCNNLGNWAAHSEFKVSNAIPVTDGEMYSCYIPHVNQYLAAVSFTKGEAIVEHGASYAHINALDTGEMIIVVPYGAKYMFISNCATSSGKLPANMPTLRRIRSDVHSNMMGVVRSVTSERSSVEVSLPDKINLVIGDEFELFYRGLTNALDVSGFCYDVTCEIGKAYSNKYVVTPETVGSYEFKVDVYDTTGNIVGTGSTMLNVVDKITTVKNINVLCVGDSLMQNGQFPKYTYARLTEDGNSISFVGRRSASSDVKLEATGGYGWQSYLAKAETNPFYNAATAAVEFDTYVDTYCSGKVDIVCVLLGWNNYSNTEDGYKSNMRKFIDMVRATLPNAKIILMGKQMPSQDGCGYNYGKNTVYKRYLEFSFNANRWEAEIAAEYDNIRFANVATQHDHLYGMPYEKKRVNKYSSETALMGTNGIHPNEVGYKQIADVLYRELTAALQ